MDLPNLAKRYRHGHMTIYEVNDDLCNLMNPRSALHVDVGYNNCWFLFVLVTTIFVVTKKKQRTIYNLIELQIHIACKRETRKRHFEKSIKP